MAFWSFFVIQWLCIVALIGYMVPLVLVGMAFVAVMFVRVTAMYRPGKRDVKRLTSTSKSPIFSHFRCARCAVCTMRPAVVMISLLPSLSLTATP